MFKGNLPNMDPYLENVGPKKPTHMGGTYPYPQHIMYPPLASLRADSNLNEGGKRLRSPAMIDIQISNTVCRSVFDLEKRLCLEQGGFGLCGKNDPLTKYRYLVLWYSSSRRLILEAF